jgi:uncharacterized membrane protein
MKSLAPILLLLVTLHYLFVACLSTHSHGLKTCFLVCCVLAGALWVSLFNNWDQKP